MTKTNKHLEHLSQIDWFNILQKLGLAIGRCGKALYCDIKTDTCPTAEFLLTSLLLGIGIVFHLDTWLIKGLPKAFSNPHRYILYWSYRAVVLGSPFLIWGIIRCVQSIFVRQRLTGAFTNAALRNRLGKFPGFVSDLPVDESSRCLKLTKAGIPYSDFDKAKPNLQSDLQIYIDEMNDNIESGTIEIIYGYRKLPDFFKIANIKNVGTARIIIGRSRFDEIIVSFSKVPHFLIAGKTDGGKSTCLRQITATLYLNNPGYRILLIDLKGGMEAQFFKNTDRITIATNIKEAIQQLNAISIQLETRMNFLTERNLKDLDAYRTALKAGKISNHPHDFDRLVIIVDEVAELFLTSEKTSTQQAQAARKALSQVTRQGRAVGVNAIVSTQRPDAAALDTQVKANLSGILCYQLPNTHSSQVVLGNGRAASIGNTKGRAVWKCGNELIEVQTPFLGIEELEEEFRPFRSGAIGQLQKPNSDNRNPTPKRNSVMENKKNDDFAE